MKQDTSWHKVADWYQKVPRDKSSNHQALIIPNLKRIFARYLFKGASVMDIACGEGSVTAALQQEGYKTSGFDLAPALIEKASQQNPEINFFVADAQKLPDSIAREHAGKYQAAVCVLAIQNIKELGQAFNTAAKLLDAHGYFIFVLNHPAFRIPKATAWGFEDNKVQYRRVDRYMSKLEVPITMHPGEKQSETTWSFHRPLQEYFHVLQNSGFSVIDLEEWASNKASEPGPRANAENQARREIPLFMTFIARKIN